MSFTPVPWRCLTCGCENGIHSQGCPNAQYTWFTYPQNGWICPRCQKSNAPWIPACDCPAPQPLVKPVTEPVPVLVAWPRVMDLLQRVLEEAKQRELVLEKSTKEEG